MAKRDKTGLLNDATFERSRRIGRQGAIQSTVVIALILGTVFVAYQLGKP